MLTGQGGPEGDLPWYTKGVVLLTSAFSIGMFAVPVSMLTWGFEAEAERCAKRTRQLEKRRLQQTSGVAEDDDYSTEEYSTDEEYQKIIAGEDSDSDGDAEALRLFQQADTDESGSISLKEYLKFSRMNQTASLSMPQQNLQERNIGARLVAMERKLDDIADKVNRICDELALSKINRQKDD